MKIVVTDRDGFRWEANQAPALPQVWMHKEDRYTDLFDTGDGVRSCASGGCPAVFVLRTPRLKVNLDKQWQWYAIAINYHMPLDNVYLLHDDRLAFCNMTGFTSLDHPDRKDYFFNRTNYPEYPKFDKDRTCSRNLLTGTVEGDYLHVKTMNGNQLPPLKPGRSYPQSIAEIRLEDYLYNPREHPWMFLVANTVKRRIGGITSVSPFPRGAQYTWTGTSFNYSFLPIVSREEVLYPLKYLTKLDMSKPFPSPYRIVSTVQASLEILRRPLTRFLARNKKGEQE